MGARVMANSPESKKRRAERLARDPSVAPHGSASTYAQWMCRCDECRAAYAEYTLDRRIAALAANFAGQRHGIPSTYNLGCRCGECTRAKYNSDARSKGRR